MADEILGSFTADAVILSPDIPGSFDVSASVPGWGDFTAWAVLHKQMPTRTFPVQASVPGWSDFTVDAVIARTIDGIRGALPIWSDTFNRTLSGTWGGSWSNTYTTYGGVNGDHVYAGPTSYAYSYIPLLDTLTVDPVDSTIDFLTPAAGGGASWRVQLRLRKSYFQISADPAPVSLFGSRYSAYLWSGGLGYSVSAYLDASTWYRVRMQRGSTRSKLKIWKVDELEPSDWLIADAGVGGSSSTSYLLMDAYGNDARADNLFIWPFGYDSYFSGIQVDAAIYPNHFRVNATLFKETVTSTTINAIRRESFETTGVPVQYEWGPGGSFSVSAVKIATIAAATYQQIVLRDGPLHYWRLNEVSGSAADAGSSPVTGTVKSGVIQGVPTAAPAPPGTAFSFPGNTTTGYVWMDGVSVAYPAYSIEAWANLTSGAGAIGGRGYNPGMMLYWDSGGFYLYHNGTSIYAAMPGGAWHHVVGVFDGSYLRLYVDGVPAAPVSWVSPATDGGYVWAIGAYNATSSSSNAALTGLISEVAFYNYALSQGQVSAHLSASSATSGFLVNAVICDRNFKANAALFKEMSGSLAVNAVKRETFSFGPVPVEALLGPGGWFELRSIRFKEILGSIGATPPTPVITPNSSTGAVDWFPSLSVGNTTSDTKDATGFLSNSYSPVWSGSGYYRGWIKLVIPAGGSLTAQFDTNGSTYDTILTLYSPDGVGSVLTGDDDSGDGACSLFTATLAGGHTHYILCSSYGSSLSTTGTMVMRITPTAVSGQTPGYTVGIRIDAVRGQVFTPSFPIEALLGPGGWFGLDAILTKTLTAQTLTPSYWTDNFNRTLAQGSGWGGTWTSQYPNTYAGVNGSQGFVGPNVNAYSYAYNTTIDAALAGVSTWDATAEFLTPPVGGSTSWRFRWTIPNTDFYLYPNTTIASPTSAYRVYLVAKGSSTNTTTFQVAPNTWYRARLQQDAGTSYIRIWKLTDPEPETWLLTRTQSTSTYTSYLQVSNYSASSTALFDNMAVWEYGKWGYQPGFTVNAFSEWRHFHSYAVLLRTQTTGKTFTVNAVKRVTQVKTPFPVEALLGPGGSFTVGAVLTRTMLAGTAGSSIYASNPIAYWPLSDATSASATEVIAGKHATPSTPANITPTTIDVIGRGWSWGAQSYLTTTFYQPSTSEATVEAWIKTTCVGEIWQGRVGTSGSGGRGISLSLQGNTGGNFGGINGHLQFFINSDGILVGVTTTGVYNDNVLHHVVGVWTSAPGVALATSQFKIYVDGVEVAVTGMDNGNRSVAPFAALTPGRFLGYNYGVYTGFAAHIAFYNRALRLEEIQTHYLRTGMMVSAYLIPMFFKADAFLIGTVYRSTTLNAVIRRTWGPDDGKVVPVEALLGPGGWFTPSALKLRTQNGPGFLSFPGTNSAGVGPGGAANLLAGPVPVNPGDTVSITFTSLSGGNIGFFAGPTTNLASAGQNSWTNVGTLPFTFTAVVQAGNYYFWPYSWDYKADKTGSGYYFPGGVIAYAIQKKTIEVWGTPFLTDDDPNRHGTIDYEWAVVYTASTTLDALILANIQGISIPYADKVLAASPVHYWKMGEPRDVALRDSVPGSSLLGELSYTPVADGLVGATANNYTVVDVDPANLSLTVIVPADGKVWIELVGWGHLTSGYNSYWDIREGTTTYANPNDQYIWSAGTKSGRAARIFAITGLTPGSYTFKWAHHTNGGGVSYLWGGPTYGPLIMRAYGGAAVATAGTTSATPAQSGPAASGTSVLFSGAGRQALLPAWGAGPAGNADRTVEVWLKNTRTDTRVVYGYGSGSSNNSFVVILNYQGVELCISTYNWDHGINVGGTLNDGNWHHLVVTYNGSSYDLTFWIDGTNFGTYNHGGATATTESGARIGELYYSDGWGPFIGSMSHLAVYPTVLDPATIAFHAIGDAGIYTEAIIFGLQAGTPFSLDAVFLDPDVPGTPFPIEALLGPGGWFGLDAIPLATIDYSSSWINPGWVDPNFFRQTAFGVGAWISGIFTANAEIWPLHFWASASIGFWFWVDAEIAPRHFSTDAITRKTFTGTPFTANARIIGTVYGSFLVRAVKRETFTGTPFTIDADKSGRINLYAIKMRDTRGAYDLRLYANIKRTWGPDDGKVVPVEYEWGPGGWFTLDSYTQPCFFVDADLCLAFTVNATILAYMGPAFLPLSYPGTNQELLGQTANVLTPQFSVGPNELMNVIVTVPPSDGGSLGAFRLGSIYNFDITPVAGQYNFPVLAGEYVIYSAQGNAYRPALTGSGLYRNWGISTLHIHVDAFILPTFRVDAEIVWLFTTLDPPPDPFTLGAWLKRIWLRSFPASAFVQPWFWVNAYSVPRHFHVSAWIIRYRSGSFTANAFLEWRHFHVSAAKKQTWTKGFTVAAFKDHPIYGFFNVDARINWYFIAQAAFVVVKYRHFTVSAVKRWVVSPPVTGWEYWWAYPPVRPTINAFVQPYFRVDAYLFRMEFFLDAVILDERERGFAANAKFVWTFLGSTTANAFVQPWFTLRAIRREELDGSLIVRSWLVKLVTVAFTINAEIRGTWAKAVIFHPDMRGVFNIYAWRGEAARTRTFLAQAEMSDPGAYWDPYTETWLHLHFLADAAIVIHREPTATVDASIAVENLSLLSFPADALIYGEPVDLFWLEAWIDAQKTIVYEGDGYTDQVLTTFTERLTFPGWDDSIGGGSNRLSSIIDTTADGERVSFTVWDWSWNPVGGSSSLGFVSVHENLWTNGPTGGGHSPQGVYQADGNTYSFIPQYSFEPHHAYAWTSLGGYQSWLTGDVMMSYKRWMTVVYSRPAPTLDAFLVGTNGDPWTIDAEIVGLTKDRTFGVDAEMSGAGERRGQIGIDAEILASVSMFWRLDATLEGLHFHADAVIFQPNITVDAWVQPYFRVDAIVLYTRKWVSGLPTINAVKVRPTRTGSFAAGADIIPVDEVRGQVSLDALVLATRGWRIYLAAYVIATPKAFSINAIVAPTFTVNAFLQPCFTVGAHIRGNSYIIFPEDGGEPTDLFGGPPPINRKFRVKIEAFIPDEIPVGNDAEIERLIWLILEAEMELEAMMCAYTHYSSQDASTVGYAPNDGGTGRTSTLPGALSQRNYPGAGDIDDCWAVATIWSANAAGYSYRPNMSVFRAAAKNPDRPGITGGSLDDVMRGARGCYPGAHIRRYHSWNWDGFISMLKAGWVASLAIRGSALPSDLRLTNVTHQLGVAYQNGAYFIMDPLQSNGSRPREISGSDLRKAARAFTGGNISACLFS